MEMTEHEQEFSNGRRAAGTGPSESVACVGGQAPACIAARGEGARCDIRRVSGACADDVLSTLLDDRSAGSRSLLRALDAERRYATAVRRSAQVRAGFLYRLRRVDASG